MIAPPSISRLAPWALLLPLMPLLAPLPQALQEPPAPHAVLRDRNGQELTHFPRDDYFRHHPATLDAIPEHLVEATLAAEDKRFFEHHGVDVMGLLRATQRNLRDRSFTQGASTLSMQLARNSYSMHQRSLHRKLLEIAITLRIESHYSKDEILTSYLNRIYFGSGCHGLDEAARTYFGIPASELTPNQCALLAGIIRAPHACSPLRNLKGALKQRDEVLDRMVDEEYITQENADSIRMGKLGLLSEPNHGTGGIIAPLIRRHFEELLKDSDINDGGLVLKSTISAGIQFIL